MLLPAKCRVGAVALSAALMAALPVHGAEISLEPTTVEMDATPGNRDRQVVIITNTDEETTVEMTIGLADWTLDREGKIRLSPPGETASSAADWVRFSPSFVTLGPGERRHLIVDMITPARLERSGDYRFALLASTIMPDARGGQSGLSRKLQVASLFYLTTDPASSDPSISDARLTVSDAGLASIDLMLANSGNAHARLEGSVLIEGDGDSFLVPISNLVVLGDSERRFSAPLDLPLPADPRVTVMFENTFAPQSDTGRAPVRIFSAPLNRVSGK